MLYSLWETDELKAAIREIEEQLVPGIYSIAYSGGGSVTNVTPSDARATLAEMYLALADRPGFGHLNKNRRGRSIRIRMKD